MGKTIYLTGAPATGKSTLSKFIAAQRNDVFVLSYNEILRDIINQKQGSRINDAGIRQHSSLIVSPEAVSEADSWVEEELRRRMPAQHVIIDSHAVTKEQFGFRVTPYTPYQLSGLHIDVLICLYTDSKILEDRIKDDPAGRPLPSHFELNLHISLQSSLAMQYSTMTGKPLYLLDSSANISSLAEQIADLARLDN